MTHFDCIKRVHKFKNWSKTIENTAREWESDAFRAESARVPVHMCVCCVWVSPVCMNEAGMCMRVCECVCVFVRLEIVWLTAVSFVWSFNSSIKTAVAATIRVIQLLRRRAQTLSRYSSCFSSSSSSSKEAINTHDDINNRRQQQQQQEQQHPQHQPWTVSVEVQFSSWCTKWIAKDAKLLFVITALGYVCIVATCKSCPNQTQIPSSPGWMTHILTALCLLCDLG